MFQRLTHPSTLSRATTSLLSSSSSSHLYTPTPYTSIYTSLSFFLSSQPSRYLHNPVRIRGKGPAPRRRLRKDVLQSHQPVPLPMTTESIPLITQPVIPYQEPSVTIPLISLLTPSTAESTTQVNPNVFGLPIRRDIIQRVVEWQRAKRRQGTHKTLGRAEVSGSNKKPHPQKGTGRARASTKRAPHMRGGGVAHGKVLRDHSIDLPQKVRTLGLKVALSAKVQEENLWMCEKITLESCRTSVLQKCVDQWESTSVLVIHGKEELDPNFGLAARNIKRLNLLPTTGINVIDLIYHQTIIMTKQACDEMTERLTAISSRSRVRYQVGSEGGGVTPDQVGDLLISVRAKEAEKARQKPIRAWGYRATIAKSDSTST